MRSGEWCLMRTLGGIAVAALIAVASPAAAETFRVTNINDAGPGSLRQAILDANSTPGHDLIVFEIPGFGVQTITPQSPLPLLTDSAGVTIDGYSQPGASPNTATVGHNGVLLIEIDGSAAGLQIGLRITSSNNIVQGLVANRSGVTGMWIEGGSNNWINGNFIGTDPSGSLALPNGGGGVLILAGASGNLVGGAAPAARNLISGNRATGVEVINDSTNNRVEGNLIGTDASGLVSLGNNRGIAIGTRASGNVIGGAAAGAGNVISGSMNSGVSILNEGTTGNVVQGNLIGTNALGSAALPNGQWGVLIFDEAHHNTIGGPAPDARNVISGNALDGVLIGGEALRNVVQGNFIGTDATGTAPLPNRENGIWVAIGAGKNLIGGDDAGTGNVIVFNRSNGIVVGFNADDLAVGNFILGNSVYGNRGLGIDLGNDGITENDPGDADVGPNNLQNFPVLTQALLLPEEGRMVIVGFQDSNPESGENRLQFFLADGDPSKHGQGRTLLLDYPGLPAGSFSFRTPPFVPPVPVKVGDLVTATATTQDGTSEFSQNVVVTAAGP